MSILDDGHVCRKSEAAKDGETDADERAPHGSPHPVLPSFVKILEAHVTESNHDQIVVGVLVVRVEDFPKRHWSLALTRLPQGGARYNHKQ